MSLDVVLLGFYSNQNITEQQEKQIDPELYETFSNVRNFFETVHAYNYGHNILDKNLLWICAQFISQELEEMKTVYKADPRKGKMVRKEFMLRTWRNFITQLEMIGFWDIGVSLITLIPEGLKKKNLNGDFI